MKCARAADGQQTGSNLPLEGPELWRRNRDDLWGQLSAYGGMRLRVSHNPPLNFTGSDLTAVARRGIHTAEVTGSIPVAPTSTNTFPESTPSAACQTICQKVTGSVR